MLHESRQVVKATPEAVDVEKQHFKTIGFPDVKVALTAKRRPGVVRLPITVAEYGPMSCDAAIEQGGRCGWQRAKHQPSRGTDEQ